MIIFMFYILARALIQHIHDTIYFLGHHSWTYIMSICPSLVILLVLIIWSGVARLTKSSDWFSFATNKPSVETLQKHASAHRTFASEFGIYWWCKCEIIVTLVIKSSFSTPTLFPYSPVSICTIRNISFPSTLIYFISITISKDVYFFLSFSL